MPYTVDDYKLPEILSGKADYNKWINQDPSKADPLKYSSVALLDYATEQGESVKLTIGSLANDTAFLTEINGYLNTIGAALANTVSQPVTYFYKGGSDADAEKVKQRLMACGVKEDCISMTKAPNATCQITYDKLSAAQGGLELKSQEVGNITSQKQLRLNTLTERMGNTTSQSSVFLNLLSKVFDKIINGLRSARG